MLVVDVLYVAQDAIMKYYLSQTPSNSSPAESDWDNWTHEKVLTLQFVVTQHQREVQKMSDRLSNYIGNRRGRDPELQDALTAGITIGQMRHALDELREENSSEQPLISRRRLTNVAADNHFSVARCARILLDVLAAELERQASTPKVMFG